MTINKISGNILQDNLQRGANLSIQGNLFYVDVVNTRLGVNTSSTTATLTVAGNAEISTTLSVSGNTTVGNLQTAGVLTATGNIIAGNLLTSGLANVGTLIVTGTSNLGPVGNVTITGGSANYLLQTNGSGGLTWVAPPSTSTILNGTSNVSIPVSSGNVNTSVGGVANVFVVTTTGANVLGTFSSSGNANVGNLGTNGAITATGNIQSGNVLTGGVVSAAGNVTGNYILGNGSFLTGVITSVANINNGTSNVTVVSSGGNVTVGIGGTGNVVVFDATGEYIAGVLSANGNVTGGNLLTAGLMSATGNIIGGNANISGTTNLGVGSTSYLQVLGNPVSPVIRPTGNAAAGLIFSSTGTGNYVFNSGSSGTQGISTGLAITGYGQNYLDVRGGASLQPVTLVASGTDTNISMILTPTGNGLVIIDTTTGLTVPSGNTDQRPVNPGGGTVRFNTFTQNLEVYNGTSWVAAGSGGNTFTITNQTISPDGSSTVYTLNQDSTSSGILLTINGVNQTPDIDYSVAGNTLTMSTAPLDTDLMQVRFLAGVVTNSQMTNSAGNAVIAVAGSGNINLQPSAGHSVNSYGNILPTSNVTYNLGSSTLRWKDLWLSGSTLTLGNIVIKNSSGNTISFYGPDGVTPATLDANAEIVADSISSGTSNVSILTANGNVRTVAGGNVTLTVTSTGANITGTLNSTGNANVGNLGATNIVGTITTASQTNITSVGTLANLSVTGNANVGNLGATNIVGTITTASQTNITSVGTLANLSVTGNVNGGNLLTSGQVISTRAGNLADGAGQLYLNGATNNRIDFAAVGLGDPSTSSRSAGTKIVLWPQIDASGVDYAIGLTSGVLWNSVHDETKAFKWFANATSIASLTGTGNLSVTGNISGGNINVTNIVGTMTTASQPNITSVGTLSSLSVTGNVTAGNLITVGNTSSLSVNSITHTGANGAGNVGSSTSYFNTVFAQATSALYADVAENFYSDLKYEPGTVLKVGGISQVTACNVYADTAAAGIVTTNPAHLMNSGAQGTVVGVALAGQVPCWVEGPVNKGDLLTTSTTVGHACRLELTDFKPGCVVAKALEDCGLNTNRKIMVMVAH